MSLLIGYYRCSVKDGRNAQWPIHVLYDSRSWPTNVLRQRGLLKGLRLTRPADTEEAAGIAASYRMLCYKYETLAGLLSDEHNRPECTVEFLQALEAAFPDLKQ